MMTELDADHDEEGAGGDATEAVGDKSRPKNGRALRILGSAAALLTVGLLAPLPDMGDMGASLLDLLHLPLFAALAFLFTRRIGGLNRSWRHGVGVWLLLVVFGAAAEGIQESIGRSASWQDLWADAVGAAFGAVAALTPPTPRGKRSLVVAFLLIFVVSNWAPLATLSDIMLRPLDGPQLADFEKRREMGRWRGHQARTRRVREFATQGEWSMQVVLQEGQYPFVSLRRLKPNWLEYTTLSFDILVERPTDLWVKIQDRPFLDEYDDLFARLYHWDAGTHHVAISLDEVASAPLRGELQMSDIGLLQFQAINVKDEIVFYLDNVRLE